MVLYLCLLRETFTPRDVKWNFSQSPPKESLTCPLQRNFYLFLIMFFWGFFFLNEKGQPIITRDVRPSVRPPAPPPARSIKWWPRNRGRGLAFCFNIWGLCPFALFFFCWGGLSSLYFWLCCFFLYLLNQVLPAKAFTCKSIYLSIVLVLLYFFALFQASAD